ncbi:MAG: hypothetical protein HKN68_10510 [Saprospiraceae bacterium]|nr:hypothetical protein [Saprospiraceae bacterium]
MKNLFFLLLHVCLFSIVITGCETSEVNSPVETPDTSILEMVSIDTDGNVENHVIDQSEVNKFRRINTTRSRGATKVRGHMDWFPNDSENTWKKSINATGTATEGRGQIEIKSNFWGDVHSSVLCVFADGGEAVVAMYIENAKEVLHPVYEEGRIVYFKLADNGEGNNDPADQHYNTVRYYTQKFDTREEAEVFFEEEAATCEFMFYNRSFGTASDIREGNFQVM